MRVFFSGQLTVEGEQWTVGEKEEIGGNVWLGIFCFKKR